MSQPLRILILEDQPDDAELVTRELKQAGFDFVAKIIATEKAFLAELRNFAPQMILADYRLPGYDGLSALAATQKHGSGTPFIFVSGSLGEERAIETLHRGATDYVLKDHLTRLGPAVKRALRERAERQERQQAEKERYEAEARFRALFEQSPDGIVILDPETTRILEFNAAAHEQLGYSREQFTRLTLEDIEVTKTPEELRTLLDEVGRAGKRDFETQHRTREGQIRQVHVTAKVVEVSGRPVHHDIWRDITARKQAEELLRESEHRFRLLFNSGYDAVFVHQGGHAGEGSGKLIEVNDIACQRLGYTREELLQLTPLDIIAPESIPDIPKVRAKLALEKSALSEGVHITKDGRRIPVEISIHVFELNGKSTRLSTVRDITERKRAQLRVAAFANLGQRLNAARTARQAGEIIVAVADELLGWDACVFDLYSAANNRVSHVLTMDVIEGQRRECKPRLLERVPTKVARRAIEEGGQLILRDDAHTAQPVGLPFGDKSRAAASLMFVPVRHGTEIVGVLSIQSYKPRAYDAYGLETLQALADHAGGALERLRAQEALDESEATFRSVWEHSIDGMRLTDQEGRIIAVNEAFCRLVKLPRERLVGQIFSVAYQGHGPKDGIEVYHQRFATGNIVPRLTARVRLWNGYEPDLEISNSFIELGQRGRMLLSIFRDVSERKHAELRIEAFSHLGQRLSAAKSAREAAGIISQTADKLLGWDACSFGLVSGSGDLLDYVLLVDTIDGQRVETSPGYFPISEFAQRTIETGGQLVLKEKMDELLAGAKPFGNAIRPSASILHVPVRNGEAVVGVVTIQSYTPYAYDARSLETLQALADHCGGALDRLRMEVAWQTSQERLRHLLTQSPAVIYSLKTDGKTTEPAWVSDNVERLLGYTVAECHGPEGLFAQVHPQNRQGVVDGLVQLIANKQIARDCRVRHKNGKFCWVRDEQRLVCDAKGAPVEIVGSWVDITERKALEEQLRQAQKMEAVGQLAGGVAHDFNNLLAVIRGNAELMLMEESLHTPESKENLTDVVEASKRAASLTRQLLAFSRKQVMQSQPLVLNEVLANLTKMLERVIGENIDLQCHYAAALPYVQADLGMMEQIILNLVVNARDAMPQGGQLRVAIENVSLDEAYVRAKPEARVGDFVELVVSDTGSGIAPEVLPRIFEPFFTTKEVGKGTGLGLATVYGIVQQHQGWIEVSSRIGEGSAFKVFLPAIPSPAPVTATPEPGKVARGGKETILLVEDDRPMRVTTRRVLESKGYQIREAANAREALEQWRIYSGEIALLLTDIIMPEEMTGRDLAVRLWEQKPALKVIFMSGYSAEVLGKNTEFIRRTRSHFLQKPCSLRDLVETVRRCLDETESATAPGARRRAK